jgi:hypothetical protein
LLFDSPIKRQVKKQALLSLSPYNLPFCSFHTETPTNQAAMAPHGEGSEEAMVVQDENRKPISSILIVIGTLRSFSVLYFLSIWVAFYSCVYVCLCLQ